jgi:ABC-2 type transport system ATP-binding protein
MTEFMIDAKGLTKSYPGSNKVAIQNVSIQVKPGEVLGFLGRNGAGKSTTMKILTCFTAPTAGEATVNGFDIYSQSLEVRRSVGYLPENVALYADMLVLEYLEFAAEMRGLGGSEKRQRLKNVVEQTTLGEVIAKPIRTLSKGFKQRVGLAQALIHEPKVMILDEPMSGLDPKQAGEMRDLIRNIGRQADRAVIFSTHNLAEVQAICSRVVIIAEGNVVADDTTEGLRDRAGKSRYVLTIKKSVGGDENLVKLCEATLKSVPGVERVNVVAQQRDEIRYEIVPRGGDDLREVLAKTTFEKGYTLLELSREGQNLEQVFRDLTAGVATPDSSAKAAA